MSQKLVGKNILCSKKNSVEKKSPEKSFIGHKTVMQSPSGKSHYKIKQSHECHQTHQKLLQYKGAGPISYRKDVHPNQSTF